MAIIYSLVITACLSCSFITDSFLSVGNNSLKPQLFFFSVSVNRVSEAASKETRTHTCVVTKQKSNKKGTKTLLQKLFLKFVPRKIFLFRKLQKRRRRSVMHMEEIYTNFRRTEPKPPSNESSKSDPSAPHWDSRGI